MKLTWNSSWVNPFESAWSIIEKIKYANAISSRQFVGEFGTRNSKGRLINQRNGLLKFNGIDLSHLNRCTGTDLYKHINYYLNKMIGMFAFPDTDILIRKHFTYCEDCLTMGYHSLLHQFIFIETCPFHHTNLNRSCKSCGVAYSCDIHNHKSTGGFQCACSYSYINSCFHSFSNWELNLPIKDSVIANWVTMDSTCFNRIKETYFYLPNLLDNNETLKFLLAFAHVEKCD